MGKIVDCFWVCNLFSVGKRRVHGDREIQNFGFVGCFI